MWQLPWPGHATSTLRSRSPGWISLTACSTYIAAFFISAVLNSYSGVQATLPIFERKGGEDGDYGEDIITLKLLQTDQGSMMMIL